MLSVSVCFVSVLIITEIVDNKWSLLSQCLMLQALYNVLEVSFCYISVVLFV